MTGLSSSGSSPSSISLKSQLNLRLRLFLNFSILSFNFGSIDMLSLASENRVVSNVTKKLLLDTMSTKKSSGTSRICNINR